MNNAHNIGRVGALAVALGVGIAVASTPAVASAKPPDSTTSSSADASSHRNSPQPPGPRTFSPHAKLDSHRDASGARAVSSSRRAVTLSPPDTRTMRSRRAAETGRRHPDTATPLSHRPAARIIADLRPSSLPVLSTATSAPPPTTPAEAPLLTLLAFARREFDHAAIKAPTINPPASALARLTVDTQLAAAAEPATFTGKPSIVSKAVSATFGLVGNVATFLDRDLTTPLLRLVSSDRPPWFTTLGLDAQSSEFEGMTVWTLQSPGSTSENTVVAIHGGALVLQPPVFNWLFYAGMARKTGATVIVPIYPLVPEGGTAGTVVPTMADLISAQIDQQGAEKVSVFGDSAGGNIAVAAAQELVRRGDPVPSYLVLTSPGLDSTLSNPAIAFVDDPVLTAPALEALSHSTELWADGLDLTDPLLSPLFGLLEGLPPTTVYAGSRDVVGPDVLRLQDKALATPGADFTFVLRNGEPHDWIVLGFLPESHAALPDIYQQLGLMP